MNDIIAAVLATNPDRHYANIRRRIEKLLEEVGELAQAHLSATSATTSRKGKTWDDVREETADCLIVALDVYLTPLEFEAVEQEALALSLHNMPEAQPSDSRSFEDGLFDLARAIGTAGGASVPPALRRVHMRNAVEISYRLGVTAHMVEEDLGASVRRKLDKWMAQRLAQQAERPDDAV